MKQYRVKVKFVNHFQNAGEKHYDYLAFEKLTKGDLVVVETQHGYSVAQVMRNVRPSEQFRGSAYVVQKVDLVPLTEFREKLAKLEFLKAEIDEAIHAMTYEQQIAKFAEDNPQLQALLDQYKEITQ